MPAFYPCIKSQQRLAGRGVHAGRLQGEIATCRRVLTVSMGWMKACAMVRAAVPAMICRTCVRTAAGRAQKPCTCCPYADPQAAQQAPCMGRHSSNPQPQPPVH